jgi:hypothetical protein
MIKTTRHGRGVFADQDYLKGEVVETCEVVFLPYGDCTSGEDNILTWYLFYWNDETLALALGNGSLYNHSGTPNMEFFPEKKKLAFYAVRNIKAGEELTISYTADLSTPTFLPKELAKFARQGKGKAK